jgi:integrase
MFSDAKDDGLVDENMFARLGHKKNTGREDITVLTRKEVEQLARIAERVHGGDFGLEFGAMIEWAAYTMMRPGEICAARHSLLDGDTYHLRRQFNSTVRRETAPKHNSTGTIYVPEPALEAIRRKPRRIDDDLIFRTVRGNQFRQESIHRAWAPVRAAFTETLPTTHHLRLRLDEDPKDQLDFYELRHFGASYMLNDLEIEPWVIAEQLRHTDGGVLIVQLYGHPSRMKAIEIMRRAHGGNIARIEDASGADAPARRRASGASRPRQ